MDPRERLIRTVRRWVWLGLATMITGVAPWAAHADDGWADGRPFGLYASDVESAAAVVDRSLVASLAPGSVLIAQTGRAGTGTAADGWQFRLTPYAWTPRTKMNLTVGQVSQSTTIDFVDIVPQLHFAFAAHFLRGAGCQAGVPSRCVRRGASFNLEALSC